jgi:DNA (cytosine-5)-methyltransferase 1
VSFRYVDLFAGIGGFHSALSGLGGECVFVSEIDEAAARVYERNWGHAVNRAHPADPVVHGDITELAPERGPCKVPKHDVLAAGFPCQPFSKSGAQEGVRDRTRGTLFFNVLRVLDERRPSVVLLENVRNIAGPRHRDTWGTIVANLRELGYKVSDAPTVFSPHFLPPSLGGTPQVRDRVFILGVQVGQERALAETDVPVVVPRAPADEGWRPEMWNLFETPITADGRPLLLRDNEIAEVDRYRVTPAERRWIDAWDDFVQRMYEVREGKRLPGFPLWVDAWVPPSRLRVPLGTPEWKADFLTKNARFYTEHEDAIDAWLRAWDELDGFPPSRRKFEWQAQDTPRLWDCVMHFRPSGIRAKRPTYLPALVAITQTSVIGPLGRRITPREAARLQGLPDWFDFGDQSDATTYKQLGNGVSVGAVTHVLREFVRQHRHDVARSIRDAVLCAERSRGEMPLVRPTDDGAADERVAAGS